MNGYQFIMDNNLTADCEEGILSLPSTVASRQYLCLWGAEFRGTASPEALQSSGIETVPFGDSLRKQ